MDRPEQQSFELEPNLFLIWGCGWVLPFWPLFRPPGTRKPSIIPIRGLICLEKGAQRRSLHCLETARRGFYVPPVTEKSFQIYESQRFRWICGSCHIGTSNVCANWFLAIVLEKTFFPFAESLPCIINSSEDAAGFQWLWLSAVAQIFFYGKGL